MLRRRVKGTRSEREINLEWESESESESKGERKSKLKKTNHIAGAQKKSENENGPNLVQRCTQWFVSHRCFCKLTQPKPSRFRVASLFSLFSQALSSSAVSFSFPLAYFHPFMHSNSFCSLRSRSSFSLCIAPTSNHVFFVHFSPLHQFILISVAEAKPWFVSVFDTLCVCFLMNT
ncbi:hypothetical protein RJT34_31307 [Clitoria ternatea]|uniref:Uncharacterized protein n=1 Tax=Clitoria ternatea TaxID=43366 RepID=A0AAN9EV46_CLITE